MFGEWKFYVKHLSNSTRPTITICRAQIINRPINWAKCLKLLLANNLKRAVSPLHVLHFKHSGHPYPLDYFHLNASNICFNIITECREHLRIYLRTFGRKNTDVLFLLRIDSVSFSSIEWNGVELDSSGLDWISLSRIKFAPFFLYSWNLLDRMKGKNCFFPPEIFQLLENFVSATLYPKHTQKQ